VPYVKVIGSKRVCRQCGGEYPTTEAWSGQFCSDTCRKQRRRDQTRACNKRHDKACENCGVAFTGWTPTVRFCSEKCSAAVVGPPQKRPELPCLKCGKMFWPKNTTRVSFCSRECSAEHMKSFGRKRARVNDSQTRESEQRRRRARRAAIKAGERFKRTEIFERDRYRCQICLGPCDPKARFPQPLTATIDHIVPLTSGGDHTKANCQTAHFVCNCEKNGK